jgi:hypothetical protein
MSSLVAELQVMLEGVPLPASKQELLEHARREDAGSAEVALLESLPDREYAALDEVGEALLPVQPSRANEGSDRPRAESGEPPGGSAYTDGSEAPGWVRDRPD